MTNFHDVPAAPRVPQSGQPAPRRSAGETWTVVDAVVSSLLTLGVIVLDCVLGFLFFFGWAMSSDACGSTDSCPAQRAANTMMLVAVVGLLLSALIALGGQIMSACKNIVMVWAPIAGLLITGLTFIIAVAMAS